MSAIRVSFVLPALIIQQVVLKTAKADTLAAEDVAGLQPSAEEQIDQKLIAVGAQALLASRLLGIEIAFHFGGDPAEREGRWGLLTEGAPLPPHRSAETGRPPAGDGEAPAAAN